MNIKEDVNWSEVLVDTKVLVSDDKVKWIKRHFALYEDGAFYTWEQGKTSFSVLTATEEHMVRWAYCELYKE